MPALLERLFGRKPVPGPEWRRRLLSDVMPGAARRAKGDELSWMLDRLDRVLDSIPDFAQYRALVLEYSGRIPGPRTRRPDDMNGPLADDPGELARLAALALAHVKDPARKSYIRKGGLWPLAEDFSSQAVLWLHDMAVHVQADLDRFDPDAFLQERQDWPEHILAELEEFWLRRHMLESKQRPVTDEDLAVAAAGARMRLGRDKALLAIAEDAAAAVAILTDVQSGHHTGYEIRKKLAEAQALITSMSMLLDERSPASDRAAYRHLSGWKSVPPVRDEKEEATP